MVRWAGGPIAVIDCFGILTDDDIRRYFELGCEVKGLGRGHIQRIKEEVRLAPRLPDAACLNAQEPIRPKRSAHARV